MSLTYSEIQGQYAAMEQTRAYVDARLPEIKALLSACERVVFVGCGSSYTLACSGALMAQLRLGLPALAIPAGDLLLHAEAYRPALERCLLVVLSRSGETSEAVLSLERLRALGIPCKVLGVSCVANATLSARSDLALELPWAFDHSVCQTRTVSSLYFFCAYAVASLAGDEALRADLRAAVAEGPAYMAANEPALRAIAQGGWTHGVVLGDAELCGLCDEAALTFKEICQLPSNYYHLLDVRHGPMVLIGKDTLVVVALSDARSKLELDLLRDLRAKGATVVAFSDEPLDMEGVHGIHFGRKMLHPTRGIPFIAICQLITYYKSFSTGANPDQPDGLAPWIALA